MRKSGGRHGSLQRDLPHHRRTPPVLPDSLLAPARSAQRLRPSLEVAQPAAAPALRNAHPVIGDRQPDRVPAVGQPDRGVDNDFDTGGVRVPEGIGKRLPERCDQVLPGEFADGVDRADEAMGGPEAQGTAAILISRSTRVHIPGGASAGPCWSAKMAVRIS